MPPLQMHGPFNFAAHRPEAAAATLRLPSLPSPPLVDLGRTPSPPPVVEIPENAEEDQRVLLSSLTDMFPDTPLEYLKEQVRAELVLVTYQQPKDMDQDKIFIAY